MSSHSLAGISRVELESEEESKNLSTEMLPSCFLVVHDSSRCGQDNLSKLSGWEEVVCPLLDVSNHDIKPRRDDSTLVESPRKIHYNFARSMIVHGEKNALKTLGLPQGASQDEI